MRKTNQARRRKPPLTAVEVAIPGAEGDGTVQMPILRRPDGYYWQAPDGHQAFGPFETEALARADRDRDDEAHPPPAETLQQAESEIGMADWIDPETGEPAEGLSPPRLNEP